MTRAPALPDALSVVVPVHNEATILQAQVRALNAALHTLVQTHEVLLVENGSTDDSPGICAGLVAIPGAARDEYPPVHGCAA